MSDELYDILDDRLSIDEFNNIGNVRKFKRLLQKTKVPQGYLSYLKDYYLKQRKITHKDMITFMVMLAYYRFTRATQTERLFDDIMFIGWQTAQEQAKIKPQDNLDTLAIMVIPNHLGWIWADYVMSELRYNSEMVMKQYVNSLREGEKIDLTPILERQQRNHLNINNGKHSGAVESHTNFVINQAMLQYGHKANLTKVKFVGIEDKVQTKMCGSLNNQVFFLNDWNVFRRYSDAVGATVEYTVFGLEVGLNLAPITNHIHYCRSSISYQVD